MVSTRSTTFEPVSRPSANKPTSSSSASRSRPPNKRALSSNHIGAPPDLFPRLSAHASRIHKAKSHILLFFLLSFLSLFLYFLNPSLLSSLFSSLSRSSWSTIGIVGAIVAGTTGSLVYWTDVYKVDWYETVAGYWWLVLPALAMVGWTVVMIQEGGQEMVDVE